MFKTWTDLRGHACKIHENSKDDERKNKEITEDNVAHRVEDKDEAELKLNSRSKKEANKNISLTWFNDRNVYDQDGTNRTTDENNNDHFSHSSLQHDFTCESCGGPYLDETMFNHHNKKYHGSNLKPQAEADNGSFV